MGSLLIFFIVAVASVSALSYAIYSNVSPYFSVDATSFQNQLSQLSDIVNESKSDMNTRLEKFRQFFVDASQVFINIAKDIWAPIVAIFNQSWDNMVSLFSVLKEKAKALQQYITENVLSIIPPAVKLYGEIKTDIDEKLQPVYDFISQRAADINTCVQAVKPVLRDFVKVFKDVMNIIFGIIGKIKELFVYVVTQIINQIKIASNILMSILQSIDDFFTKILLDPFEKYVAPLITGFFELIEENIDLVLSVTGMKKITTDTILLLQKVVDAVGDIKLPFQLSPAYNFIIDMYNQFVSFSNEIYVRIIDVIKSTSTISGDVVGISVDVYQYPMVVLSPLTSYVPKNYILGAVITTSALLFLPLVAIGGVVASKIEYSQ